MPLAPAAAWDFTADEGLDYHSPAVCQSDRQWARISPNKGEHAVSKSQDAKKNVKKVPSKSPKEKKEAKRMKKAEKKH